MKWEIEKWGKWVRGTVKQKIQKMNKRGFQKTGFVQVAKKNDATAGKGG